MASSPMVRFSGRFKRRSSVMKRIVQIYHYKSVAV